MAAISMVVPLQYLPGTRATAEFGPGRRSVPLEPMLRSVAECASTEAPALVDLAISRALLWKLPHKSLDRQNFHAEMRKTSHCGLRWTLDLRAQWPRKVIIE